MPMKSTKHILQNNLGLPQFVQVCQCHIRNSRELAAWIRQHLPTGLRQDRNAPQQPTRVGIGLQKFLVWPQVLFITFISENKVFVWSSTSTYSKHVHRGNKNVDISICLKSSGESIVGLA